jgi:hypothetical protein
MTEEICDAIFFHARQLLPALRFLARDPKVARPAIRLLARIGIPADMRSCIENYPPADPDSSANRWKYEVATAMLEPGSDAEWDFLRRCAAGKEDDGWADRGAVETLRLIASPRSLGILKEVRDPYWSGDSIIPKAIAYINSNPAPLASRSLAKATARVAQAIKVGKWQSNGPPRYNAERDMALVNSVFIAGNDELTYTATFHLIDGVWKLRGVRETRQAYFRLFPNPPKSAVKKHPQTK